MEALKTLLIRLNSEIYLNNKTKLRGQMMALIGINVAMILNKENNEEFVLKVNRIYESMMIKVVQRSPEAKKYFEMLSQVSDTNLSTSFAMIEKLGDGDLLGETDLTRNIPNIEWERGVLAVEVVREASPVVRF